MHADSAPIAITASSLAPYGDGFVVAPRSARRLGVACADQPMPSSLTECLWADVVPVFDAFLVHPFVRGLTSSDERSPDRLAYHVVRDDHNLRDCLRALAVVGAKAHPG
jgi:hypothetical protein